MSVPSVRVVLQEHRDDVAVRAEHRAVRRVLAQERERLVGGGAFRQRVDRFDGDAACARQRNDRLQTPYVRAREQTLELRVLEDVEQSARLEWPRPDSGRSRSSPSHTLRSPAFAWRTR